MATEQIFRDERAERRQVPFATRPRGIHSFDVRVANLEKRESIDRLLEAVGATTDQPGYAFIVVGMDGGIAPNRYYPVRLAATPR